MASFTNEKVRGANVDGEQVHIKCMTSAEIDNLTQDDILTDLELDEEGFHFCDRCKKRL
jgi:hypothetical protein